MKTKNKKYDIVFIPGVGSFHNASKILLEDKIRNFIFNINSNSVIFGICLGMQLMFRQGSENGKSEGLNFVNGEVNKLPKNLISPCYRLEKNKFFK